MKLPEFSPQSVDDLKGILIHVARDKPQAAERLVERLKEKCQLLMTMPFAGTRRDDLSPGLRAFSMDRYVIYFHPTDTGIRVERVLHGAQDIDELFFG
jgi:toxin ParE1/3/4